MVQIYFVLLLSDGAPKDTNFSKIFFIVKNKELLNKIPNQELSQMFRDKQFQLHLQPVKKKKKFGK